MTVIEMWRDIAGFDDKYQINTCGRIRIKKTGKYLKPSVDKSTGYLKVNLWTGKNNIKTVHRLVAETFICNPHNFSQVHHIDGDKTNNVTSNLEWVSAEIHGKKMTDEQKAKFRETCKKNQRKRQRCNQM